MKNEESRRWKEERDGAIKKKGDQDVRRRRGKATRVMKIVAVRRENPEADESIIIEIVVVKVLAQIHPRPGAPVARTLTDAKNT